jgi:hypothetical protein
MLDFVARVFRGWMNVLLWLILIGCAIGGFVTGGSRGWGDFNNVNAFLGLLVGSIVGLIIIILYGGLIANFLNMVDNIEAIKHHLSKTGNTSVDSSVINSGDSWVCKKCNTQNNITASFCKNCGEHK